MIGPDDDTNSPKNPTEGAPGDEAARAESIQASIARLVKQSQELLQTGERLAEEVETMRQASIRKHTEDEMDRNNPPEENPDPRSS